AEQRVRPADFTRGGFNGLFGEFAFLGHRTQIFAGKFLRAHRPVTDSKRPELVAIEQVITMNLPTLPTFRLRPDADSGIRERKEQIGQSGNVLAADPATFAPQGVAAMPTGADPVELDGVHRRPGR